MQGRILCVGGRLPSTDGMLVVLSTMGCVAQLASTVEHAVALARSDTYPLALVAPPVPDLSVPDVCGRLRASSDAMRIVVVGTGRGQHELVPALDAGADDYVVDPFWTESFRARIRALLRRSEPSMRAISATARSAPTASAALLAWGPFELHLEQSKVLVDGEAHPLTPRQMRIMSRLVRNAGKSVFHQDLWRDFECPNQPPCLATIRVHVHALRRRLGAHGPAIQTVTGRGYGLGLTPCQPASAPGGPEDENSSDDEQPGNNDAE